MFGKYDLKFNIEKDDIKIFVEDDGKRKLYHRTCQDEHIEKYIHCNEGRIVICPVEPVNIPDPYMTENLQIEFKKPLIIAPGERDIFYSTFPLEIGVFLVNKKDIERIDIFSKTKAKYTLYGPPENGLICKWWPSDIFSEIPVIDVLYEGIIKVNVKNNYNEWIELKHLVFNGVEMKMFYGEYAYLSSFLNIQKRTVGDTGFFSKKQVDMSSSIDIYKAKGFKALENFIMEWGFK